MLATYRPGYRPPLDRQILCGTGAGASHCHGDDQFSNVVRSVLNVERIIELATEEIVAKADGNPLFLEQLDPARRRSEGSSIGPDGAGHDP